VLSIARLSQEPRLHHGQVLSQQAGQRPWPKWPLGECSMRPPP
jgi:hypothetical protein